ncbi:MAG: hypothetical protein DHS20C14_06560 [Phycisphaeraceae bacterium]|nr:MAG: hypothetical protein DHS20C14_06560 [Phycisphaeraceae bacterium]
MLTAQQPTTPRRILFAATALALIGGAQVGVAGTVTVKVDAGEGAAIGVRNTTDDGWDFLEAGDDINSNGRVVFNVPLSVQGSGQKIVYLKTIHGKTKTGTVCFTAGATALSLEPFELPDIVAPDDVHVSFTLADFLIDEPLLPGGSMTTGLDGQVAGFDSMTLSSQPSFSNTDPLDMIDELYAGLGSLNAWAGAFEFDVDDTRTTFVVPGPASWACMGLAAPIVMRRRRAS